MTFKSIRELVLSLVRGGPSAKLGYKHFGCFLLRPVGQRFAAAATASAAGSGGIGGGTGIGGGGGAGGFGTGIGTTNETPNFAAARRVSDARMLRGNSTAIVDAAVDVGAGYVGDVGDVGPALAMRNRRNTADSVSPGKSTLARNMMRTRSNTSVGTASVTNGGGSTNNGRGVEGNNTNNTDDDDDDDSGGGGGLYEPPPETEGERAAKATKEAARAAAEEAKLLPGMRLGSDHAADVDYDAQRRAKARERRASMESQATSTSTSISPTSPRFSPPPTAGSANEVEAAAIAAAVPRRSQSQPGPARPPHPRSFEAEEAYARDASRVPERARSLRDTAEHLSRSTGNLAEIGFGGDDDVYVNQTVVNDHVHVHAAAGDRSYSNLSALEAEMGAPGTSGGGGGGIGRGSGRGDGDSHHRRRVSEDSLGGFGTAGSSSAQQYNNSQFLAYSELPSATSPAVATGGGVATSPASKHSPPVLMSKTLAALESLDLGAPLPTMATASDDFARLHAESNGLYTASTAAAANSDGGGDIGTVDSLPLGFGTLDSQDARLDNAGTLAPTDAMLKLSAGWSASQRSAAAAAVVAAGGGDDADGGTASTTRSADSGGADEFYGVGTSGTTRFTDGRGGAAAAAVDDEVGDDDEVGGESERKVSASSAGTVEDFYGIGNFGGGRAAVVQDDIYDVGNSAVPDAIAPSRSAADDGHMLSGLELGSDVGGALSPSPSSSNSNSNISGNNRSPRPTLTSRPSLTGEEDLDYYDVAADPLTSGTMADVAGAGVIVDKVDAAGWTSSTHATSTAAGAIAIAGVVAAPGVPAEAVSASGGAAPRATKPGGVNIDAVDAAGWGAMGDDEAGMRVSPESFGILGDGLAYLQGDDDGDDDDDEVIFGFGGN